MNIGYKNYDEAAQAYRNRMDEEATTAKEPIDEETLDKADEAFDRWIYEKIVAKENGEPISVAEQRFQKWLIERRTEGDRKNA